MTDETPLESFTGDDLPGEQPDQVPEDQNDSADVSEAPSGDPDVFSREYVSELRDEAKTQRLRARDAESERDRLREHLWVARVDALGLLADPTDLPVDVDALDDPDAIRAAVDALLARKPHLARRRAVGDIGQHDVPDPAGFSLASVLARAAGA